MNDQPDIILRSKHSFNGLIFQNLRKPFQAGTHFRPLNRRYALGQCLISFLSLDRCKCMAKMVLVMMVV